MGLVDGHRAIVTGGGSGIGRAVAKCLTAEGATVAVIDLNAETAAQVAADVSGKAYPADVTDAEALRRAVEAAAADMGGLSIMVNNAGTGGMAFTHDYRPEEWGRIVGVNLTGVYHGFRAAVPLLLAGGGGSIVSTASISGTRPAAGEAPYAAAKAAVAALTATAALEYAPTIRVNAVSPGMIRTGMTSPLLDGFPDIVERMRAKTPLGRIGEPEDIADVVVFLCSDRARFITGQNLVIDGGMTLHGSGVDGLLDYFFQR